MTPSNANTSGLSEIYLFAYESIRNGAPGLSDATCAAIARSINMKVSLSTKARATAAEARADRLAGAVREALSHCGSDGYLNCGKPATDGLRAALQQEPTT
jgi:hypothetical protein